MNVAGQQPIGYWLKRVDSLIDLAFDRALAAAGLGRRHWQLMHTLANGTATGEVLRDELRPFWVEGAVTFDDVIGELIGRDWIAGSVEGGYGLTQAGVSAHTGISATIMDIRRGVVDGVSAGEYEATVAVLRRMAGNLERASEPAGQLASAGA